MRISIIIPTYNEAAIIGASLEHIIGALERPELAQLIVVDGGSTDATIAIARTYDIKIVETAVARRSIQLNAGAEKASAPVLFFLHIDSCPPHNFDALIISAIEGGGHAGCFRLRFDCTHPLLRFFGWCTRFNWLAFRFGDRGVFVTEEVFHREAGFRNDMQLLEGHELLARLHRRTAFVHLCANITTSARRYRSNGVFRLQLIFSYIYMLYHLGASQGYLKRIYDSKIY